MIAPDAFLLNPERIGVCISCASLFYHHDFDCLRIYGQLHIETSGYVEALKSVD